MSTIDSIPLEGDLEEEDIEYVTILVKDKFIYLPDNPTELRKKIEQLFALFKHLLLNSIKRGDLFEKMKNLGFTSETIQSLIEEFNGNIDNIAPFAKTTDINALTAQKESLFTHLMLQMSEGLKIGDVQSYLEKNFGYEPNYSSALAEAFRRLAQNVTNIAEGERPYNGASRIDDSIRAALINES